MRLVNLNALWSFGLFFFEGDSKDPVFKDSLDAIFFDLNWQCDSAAEFAPVAFLDVPLSSFIVFATVENTRNGN